MSKKMTLDEIADLFGGEIPMEAVQFIFVTAPPDMTLREVRNELEEMAERYRAKVRLNDKELPTADEIERLRADNRRLAAEAHSYLSQLVQPE